MSPWACIVRLEIHYGKSGTTRIEQTNYPWLIGFGYILFKATIMKQ
jgi:hypothetical protein